MYFLQAGCLFFIFRRMNVRPAYFLFLSGQNIPINPQWKIAHLCPYITLYRNLSGTLQGHYRNFMFLLKGIIRGYSLINTKSVLISSDLRHQRFCFSNSFKICFNLSLRSK